MNKSASIGPINKSCFFSTHAVSCRNYQPQRPYLCRYSHYFLFNSKLFVYFFALVLICATVVFPSFSARCYGEVVFAARGNLARDEIKDNSALISIPAVLNGKPSFKSNSLFNFSNQENIYNISAHDGLLLGGLPITLKSITECSYNRTRGEPVNPWVNNPSLREGLLFIGMGIDCPKASLWGCFRGMGINRPFHYCNFLPVFCQDKLFFSQLFMVFSFTIFLSIYSPGESQNNIATGQYVLEGLTFLRGDAAGPFAKRRYFWFKRCGQTGTAAVRPSNTRIQICTLAPQ